MCVREPVKRTNCIGAVHIAWTSSVEITVERYNPIHPHTVSLAYDIQPCHLELRSMEALKTATISPPLSAISLLARFSYARPDSKHKRHHSKAFKHSAPVKNHPVQLLSFIPFLRYKTYVTSYNPRDILPGQFRGAHKRFDFHLLPVICL